VVGTLGEAPTVAVVKATQVVYRISNLELLYISRKEIADQFSWLVNGISSRSGTLSAIDKPHGFGAEEVY